MCHPSHLGLDVGLVKSAFEVDHLSMLTNSFIIIIFIMHPVGPIGTVPKSQVSSLCSAMPTGSLPGSQGLSAQNNGSP